MLKTLCNGTNNFVCIYKLKNINICYADACDCVTADAINSHRYIEIMTEITVTAGRGQNSSRMCRLYVVSIVCHRHKT